MKQSMKPTWLILGSLGIAGFTGLFSFNSENMVFRLDSALTSISAIFVLAWATTVSKLPKSRWYQNPLFLILLLVISFFPPLTNQNRWLALLLFTSCSFLFDRDKISREKFMGNLLRFSCFFLLLKGAFVVLSKVSDYVLQFLSFGYDNAFHFAIYRYYRAEPWFPFGTQTPWGTDFGLFNTYPSAQGALWSFLAEPIIGDNLDSRKNLIAYAAINLAILILISWLIFRNIQKNNRGRSIDLLFVITASLTIGIGYFGIFFTNGFIPYAAGVLILLIYTLIQGFDLDQSSRYLSAFFATLILLLTSPALIAFLFLPGLISSFQYFKEAISARNDLRVLFMVTLSIAMAFMGFFFQVITSSNFGWRLILTPGGVIAPSKIVVVALVLGIASNLAIRWRYSIISPTVQLVLSGALSVFFLSAITVIYTGTIQYYAVKQLHVWVVFAAMSIAITLLKIKCQTTKKNSMRIVFIILLVVPLTTSTSFSSPWMGNMFGVVSATIDKTRWESQIVDVELIRSGLRDSSTKNTKAEKCIILRAKNLESDLNSRWINALNVKPSITDACFAAFWNSAPLTDKELELRLGGLDDEFIILTNLSQKTPSLNGSNFEYLRINK
jgi:hypothetical protein